MESDVCNNDRCIVTVDIVLLQLKNKYLHMVMTNLDSEGKELSSSTVDTMKKCMAKVSVCSA